jgi:hypothetical protein
MSGLLMKYFVLKPTGDDAYAKASRSAMRKYADAIAAENADLAADLRDWVSRSQPLEESDWQPIETAPHEVNVLLGWWHKGKWESEVGSATHGWRRGNVSNMSQHTWATHWQPLPSPPNA